MKLTAITRLKETARHSETAASVTGLAALANKTATEAIRGGKGPMWTKVLFSAKLKSFPSEEELRKLGFKVFNYDKNTKPLFSIEWHYSDGVAVAVFPSDVFLELKSMSVDNIKDPDKYHNELEKVSNALIKKYG